MTISVSWRLNILCIMFTILAFCITTLLFHSYVKVCISFTCRKYLLDRIILLIGIVWSHKTYNLNYLVEWFLKPITKRFDGKSIENQLKWVCNVENNMFLLARVIAMSYGNPIQLIQDIHTGKTKSEKTA
jgi:hypothetical protein